MKNKALGMCQGSSGEPDTWISSFHRGVHRQYKNCDGWQALLGTCDKCGKPKFNPQTTAIASGMVKDMHLYYCQCVEIFNGPLPAEGEAAAESGNFHDAGQGKGWWDVAKPTHETFLKDVSNHEMTVVRNDGLYRHLVFAKGNSWCMRFEIITWPHFLCYTGDMGTFVFSRIEDMFAFFRNGDSGRINPDYWSEKIQATDRTDGHREWSADKFRKVIEYYLTERSGEPVSDEIRQAVKDEVLSRIEDGSHEAYRAASEFEHDGFRFDDLWDHNFEEFTYRFIWCCYALVWGIAQYDLVERGVGAEVGQRAVASLKSSEGAK